MKPIALATCAAHPQLFGAEQALMSVFGAAGAEASPVVWDDHAIDWTAFECVVVRSTWDYHQRPGEFMGWVEKLERSGVRLFNPPRLLRWNLDKRYLLELADAGVPVVPTRIVERDQPVDLTALAAAAGWTDVVIKPAISAGADRTHLVRATDLPAQQTLEELAKTGAVLVQQFVPEITGEGEWSLFYFAGRFSHAVLKKPVEGEFRIDAMKRDGFRRLDPPAELRRVSEHTLARLPMSPLYARIDGIRSGPDFLVIEVELIEPGLYLSLAPDAADRYVAAVLAALTEAR
jgi:glutathione synthase/RimK-type ligase-like ATP-grasp enzyme